ncbi:hypothetical protein Ddc_13645 [Ditylenchus destructor]|nr:hypothetical protein Ddc_13645 [Ditylenchus destructor]
MRALESIAHVAENRIMGINMCATLTENAIAIATFNFNLIFSTQKLLGVRQLKLHDSYFKFMPESGYKCIYTNLDVLEIYSLNENNLELMLNLIENKAKYPDREMCFVCRTYDKNHVIKDFVKNICKKFCDSSVPYNYSLVIESSTVVLLDSEEEELDLQKYQLDMDEFRLENGQTKEMLQLKKVSIEDVKENYNADFEPNTDSSIFLLKRSRIEKKAPEK